MKTVSNTVTTDQWGQVQYVDVGAPRGSNIISAVVLDVSGYYCVCASNIRVYVAGTTAENHIVAPNVSVKIKVAYI